MSLLLDALKKAANEKKKVAEGENESIDSDASDPQATELPAIDKPSDIQLEDQELELVELIAEDSLTLDEPDSDRIATEKSNKTGNAAGCKSDHESGQVIPIPPAKLRTSQVSDEALSLLIDKTNRDYKKSKYVWVMLVVVISLTVLATGAMYFVQSIRDEKSLLEKRHRSAMRIVREKTRNDKLPEKTNIIKNLVSDEKLENKVSFARNELARKKQAASARKTRVVNRRMAVEPVTENHGKAIHISRDNLPDPVSVLLEKAWLDYERGNFNRSRKIYEKVLAREKNNRDALLGLAAIARQDGHVDMAQDYYFRLLALDPADPDAIAELTSMASSSQASFSEQKIKQLLDGNRQSATLHFALGNLYARQKKWKAAQEEYFNAWANDKNNQLYTYNLAVSLDQLGKPGEAAKFYKLSLELAGNSNTVFSRQAVMKRLQTIQDTGK